MKISMCWKKLYTSLYLTLDFSPCLIIIIIIKNVHLNVCYHEDLKLYFIVPNSKPNTKILPLRIKRYSLDSNIIDSKYVILISNWIDKKQKDPLLLLNQQQQQERTYGYYMKIGEKNYLFLTRYQIQFQEPCDTA